MAFSSWKDWGSGSCGSENRRHARTGQVAVVEVKIAVLLQGNRCSTNDIYIRISVIVTELQWRSDFFYRTRTDHFHSHRIRCSPALHSS